jgi:hypothetical protein
MVWSNISPAQVDNRIIVNESVRLFPEEEMRQKLVNRLTEYLTKFPDEIISFSDKELLENVNEVIKMPEYDTSSFKWQLLNCVPFDNNVYQIKLSLIGQLKNGSAFCPLSIASIAEQQSGDFKIKSPFYFNTEHWNSTEVSQITFFHQYSFNRKEATKFVEHSEFLADKLGVEPITLDYYKCKNIQEVYKLIGIEYSVRINGVSRGSLTNHDFNIFLSGTNKDEYSHDLTHFYFEKATPGSIRNWTAEEGYNITVTDYWGESLDTILTYLTDYMSGNPDRTFLEIFNSNELVKAPIRARMPIAAVLIRKIEREQGFDKILEIIKSGSEKEDFLVALNLVAGINESNFDKTVKTELNL